MKEKGTKLFLITRDFMGYELNAVVSAEDEAEALQLLDWNIDEDTRKIQAIIIGKSYIAKNVICEETL